MRLSELLEAASTWIDALKFVNRGSTDFGDDDNTKTGDVIMRLKSGQRYEVNNVPREVYDAWATAPSAGKFYHENIKGQYVII